MALIMKFVFDGIENMVGKGDNTDCQAFSFSYIVFKNLFYDGWKNSGLWEKGSALYSRTKLKNKTQDQLKFKALVDSEMWLKKLKFVLGRVENVVRKKMLVTRIVW